MTGEIEPSEILCTDIEGWYDSYGSDYNCNWYASNPAYTCFEYGNQHENLGHTASTACCVCKDFASMVNNDTNSNPVQPPHTYSMHGNDTISPTSNDYPTFAGHPSEGQYDKISYSDHIDGSGAVIAAILLAVLVMTVFGFSCCKARLTRQQHRIATENNNDVDATPATPESDHSKNNDSDPASLRKTILEILLPAQTSIQKERMGYDVEEESYCYGTAANGGNKSASSASPSASCGICLDCFLDGDVLMIGLCRHVYHRDCCMGWVMKENSCPLCRGQMFDESIYKVIKESIVSGNPAEEC